MFVYCALQSKKTPHTNSSRKINGVYDASSAKQAVEEYLKTLRNNILVQATLMESGTKAIRTIYKNGEWYY